MVRTNRPLVERMTLVWHDWFATSNEGVGSQRLMLRQNALFRRHALGSFERLLLDVTRDPAMLLWLNGNENTALEPERELRARADGAVHARRRPRLHRARRARAGAGADRLRQRLAAQRRADAASATTPARTTRASSASSAAAAASTGGTRAGCALDHRMHPSFFVLEALGLLRARPRPPRRRSAGWSGCTVERLPRSAGRRGDPAPPRPLRGAADDEAAVVYTAGLLRMSGGPSTTTRGPGSAALRAAALLPAERVRLGRRALARHGDLPRPLGHGEPRPQACGDRPEGRRAVRRGRAARPRAPLLGRADADGRDAPVAAPLRAALARRREAVVEARRLRGDDRERAPPARSPSPPTSRRADGGHCCNEYSRSRSCAGPPPRRARACRRSSRACRCRRARASTAARFLARSVGLALSVYGAGALAPRALERGHRRRGAAPSRSRCSSPSSSTGGLDSLSTLFPSATPTTGAAADARAARLEPGVRRGRAAALASGRRRRSDSSMLEGKLAVLPAVGYTNADQSHFTSRHYWEVGADRRRPAHRLARPLPRPRRRRRQPAAGAEPRRRALAVLADVAACRSRRCAAPTGYGFWARNVWGEVEGAHARGDRGPRRGRRLRRPRSGSGGGRGHAGRRLRRQLAPFRQRKRRLRQPGGLPEHGDQFPRAARRPRGDARRRAAAPLRRADGVRHVRHALRSGRISSPAA